MCSTYSTCSVREPHHLCAMVPSTAKWTAMRRRGPLNTRSPSAEVTSLQKGIFKMALDQGVSNNSLQSTDRK